MHKSEYQNIYKNEASHFFYVGNHKIIVSLIKRYLSSISSSKYVSQKKDIKLNILDIGCGTGLLAKKMEIFGRVTGIDYSTEALKFAKKRGIKTRKASILALPFKNNEFDIVLCIDVITDKSIKNDSQALKEIFRVIKPGGIAIIRASANKWLHLIHDKHVHIRERYSKQELYNKLKVAGFIIEKMTFVNMILLPAAVINSIFEKNPIFEKKHKSTKSAIFQIPPILNNILSFIISLEAYLLKSVNIPFGIAIIAVSRKPKLNI